MPTLEYVRQFFPFEKPDLQQNGDATTWEIKDKEMQALALAMEGVPMAVNLSFHRTYSEPYEWLCAQLKDWAFTVLTSVFYYEEVEEVAQELMRRGMNAFGGSLPRYHVILAQTPTLVWDFHSLLAAVQMVFSFALTDKAHPLRVCKHCGKAFVAENPQKKYCSRECRTAGGAKRYLRADED